ncbi:MAG: ribose-phosphate pyrophosphokinase [Deltaproteobacteria bacterium]|nr:ribose-phosphate pyrophosphokinase [Deltaproteobacteria bacterium]
MTTSTTLVYATESYGYMLRALCALPGFEEGAMERRRFPDDERYLRLITPPAGRNVAILGGTISDADTLELFDLASGVVTDGARRLTLVIPYFGCSTMERAVHPGEIVTAKTRARLLSAIPSAPEGNRALLLDLHSEGLPYYFEGGLVATHLHAMPVVSGAVKRLGGDNFVLACTDAGRAKWVQRLANEIGVAASFVFKRRHDDGSTEVIAASANLQGRRVVIYDDMIRSGGTLVGAAEAYRAAGATSIAVVTTHGLFCGDALPRLCRSGLFQSIVCTDSHPRALELQSPELAVESVVPLLARALRPQPLPEAS